MESIIVSYRQSAERISDKYGITHQVRLYEKRDLKHLSKQFCNELADNALYWLMAVTAGNKDGLHELVAEVNMINLEQRQKFSNHCKESQYLAAPFNTLGLN